MLMPLVPKSEINLPFCQEWITELEAMWFDLQIQSLIVCLNHFIPGSSLHVAGIRSWRNWNFQDLSGILEPFSCWAVQGKSVLNVSFSTAFRESTLWCSSKEAALLACFVQGNPWASEGTIKIQILLWIRHFDSWKEGHKFSYLRVNDTWFNSSYISMWKYFKITPVHNSINVLFQL